jgi:uncharacterized protein (DUF1330 family)
MPAYLIVYYNVTNSEQFKKYLEAVGPLIHKRGGRKKAGGSPDVVDGPFPWERAVVFEWPSRKDAIDFRNSDEYKEIKQIRVGGSEFQGIILEGIT